MSCATLSIKNPLDAFRERRTDSNLYFKSCYNMLCSLLLAVLLLDALFLLHAQDPRGSYNWVTSRLPSAAPSQPSLRENQTAHSVPSHRRIVDIIVLDNTTAVARPSR